MPSNNHLNLPPTPSGKDLSPTKIYQAEDFDDAIINAMNASSEKVDAENGAASGTYQRSDNDNGSDNNFERRGSFGTDSSDSSEADNMSLESDDMSMASDYSDKNDRNDNDHDSVSHVPLVNDDESVIEMKNPAPVSQSVSSYVDQLNRKERGKSTMIKAGVCLAFIAIIVGVPLAVISTKNGNKSKEVSDGNAQSPGSPWTGTGDENVLDNIFRSVEIRMNGTLSLSGLVIPNGKVEDVKDTLEKSIADTVSKSLTQDQNVIDVSVTSIDGSERRIRYRVLEEAIVLVEYEMTVEERCRDCNDKILQNMKEVLFQQVASDFTKAIATGDFTEDLHKQATSSGNNALLSAIAIDGNFETQSALPTQPDNAISREWPTQSPTPQQVPEFNLPQILPPSPTPPPRPIPDVAANSPVAQTYVSTPSPTTMAPITSSPTLSPVTAAPVTQAPFALPPVEFVPTDPPVLTAPPVELVKPTKSPTKRPTPRPTIRPTPR